ncbi:MAG: hypothetical protein ACI93R_001586 [Flavobacteriales bacterium]|jgi:hypothetical protein
MLLRKANAIFSRVVFQTLKRPGPLVGLRLRVGVLYRAGRLKMQVLPYYYKCAMWISLSVLHVVS